ncbi:hypothetical protein ABZ885_41770, partial [Kitasatospora sp. NPDC047058]
MTERDTGPFGHGPDGYGPDAYESGAHGAGDSGPGADTEVERELRVLLHRAAPHLPAPDDRMDRIRERADRARRRRRAAALAAG